MKKSLLTIFIITLLSGCSICHTYGPFMGKVVEKENGKPIEGALVMMHFVKEGFGMAASYSSYEKWVQVMTDGDGEFIIPAKTIWNPGFLEWWDESGYIMIFKPGYGYYSTRESEPLLTPDDTIPPNEHIVIKLPKLETREERRSNLDMQPFIVPDKMKKYYELKNKELKTLGLPTYKSK